MPLIKQINLNEDGTVTSYDIGAEATNVMYDSSNNIKTKIDDKMTKGVDYVTAGQLTGSTLGTRATAEGESVVASFTNTHAEGYKTTASGANAHAEGSTTVASGAVSHAEGSGTSATGNLAHAEGSNTSASGAMAHTEGSATKATQANAHAEGQASTASGYRAHAEGRATFANGENSHAEGGYTSAIGEEGHAEGYLTCAIGNYSHTEGQNTAVTTSYGHAEGSGSKVFSSAGHAEGSYTTATGGTGTHAEGGGTLASGSYSHAEGYHTCAYGYASHAEGNATSVASGTSIGQHGHAEGYQTYVVGNNAHAEGANTTALGANSHAEGASTCAETYAHAEGDRSYAVGQASHAEGQNTYATGTYSHSEGSTTTASQAGAHAEGNHTLASGFNAHAEGVNTTASGSDSHAEGSYTSAGYDHQHVMGTYNDNKETNVFEIGWGTDITPANIFEVNTDGDVKAAGDVIDGNNIKLSEAQLRNLSSAITIGGVSQTTVENALNALNNTKSDISGLGTAAFKDAGATNGVAELDSNGKVPAAQLPSFVDDVIEGYLYDSTHLYEEKIIDGYYDIGVFYEDAEHTIAIVPEVGVIYNDITEPTTGTYAQDDDTSTYVSAIPISIVGESGKIYVDLNSNNTYRWSGSMFAIVSESLALGETSSTAYRGDRGKAAYDHSQVVSGNPHNVTAADIGLGNVGNFKAVSTVANQELTTTEQENARTNIGAGTSNLIIGNTADTAAAGNHTHGAATTTEAGFMSANDKIRIDGAQMEILSSPIVVAGETKFTVETALSAINDNASGGSYYKDFKSNSQLGLTNFYGKNVWHDGNNTYHSTGSYQYILNRNIATWETKTWSGLTQPNRVYIQSDGDNIYYSQGTNHYILDRETSTWESKTQTGLTNFNGNDIQTDGDNIYYDNNNNHYILDKDTSTQSINTQNGITTLYGQYIWYDGNNIYYSYQTQNVLNKETSTQLTKTQTNNLGSGVNLYGNYIQTDGVDVYFSNGTSVNGVQGKLDRETSTWNLLDRLSEARPLAEDIWQDNGNIYWSTNGVNAVFTEIPVEDLINVPNGLAGLNSNGRISINQTNYVTAGQRSGTTLGSNATAEGANNIASGSYAHAEGSNTTVTGAYAHAEGNATLASAQGAHAEGASTTASHPYAHASGYQTKTGKNAQFVVGTINTGSTDTLFEVGNGTHVTTDRHNAFEVKDKNGSIKIGDTLITTIPTGARGTGSQQTFQPNTTSSTSHQDYTGYWVKFNVGSTTMKEGLVPQTYEGITVDTTVTTADGTNEDQVKVVIYSDVLTEGGIVVDGEVIDGTGNTLSEKANTNHTHGTATTSTAGFMSASDKEKLDGVDTSTYMIKGTDHVTAGAVSGSTLGNDATAEGFRTVSSNSASHAEGAFTTASGPYSHAEGYNTSAFSEGSHAEGEGSVASSACSHAEGADTVASGDPGAHAEGWATTASGGSSHAEGQGTIAGYDYQHVQGKFNDNKSTSLFEIGNGTADNERFNAFEVDQGGDVVAAGNITDGLGNKLSEKLNSSDISSQAKASTKPTYTASEVGAVSTNSFQSDANTTRSTNDIAKNTIGYFNSGGPSSTASDGTGSVYAQAYSSLQVNEIAQDFYNNGHMYVRSKQNNTWGSWKSVPTMQKSTTDITVGSALPTDELYIVYEA